jgi:hypothetical protein
MDSSSDEDIALTYMKQRGDDDDNDDDWMASSRDSDREEVGIPAAHLDDEQQHTDPGECSYLYSHRFDQYGPLLTHFF